MSKRNKKDEDTPDLFAENTDDQSTGPQPQSEEQTRGSGKVQGEASDSQDQEKSEDNIQAEGDGVEMTNGHDEDAPHNGLTGHGLVSVSGMYENYYLDYASYVILERAVPALEDGLKPVQRRILHSMRRMEDGRFHKVANVIGHTMQFHPHGDAAIGDAIVNLGQKELLIDTQGNWGDTRTGDRAAAPRYIEARLSRFALEVVFNPQTTEWQMSYDGRNKEPVDLPVKFPLLLAQGVEGIAVGLATKIMPHNFVELCEASIAWLKGRKPKLLPDFPNGGMMDASNYNGGQKGGRIRLRAHIETVDKRTLNISSIPYGVTTQNLIDSIIKANDSGKIKIKKVEDQTARDVNILVHLAPNTSPDVTLDALYAFTHCEVSISPNCCVIVDNHPQFISVNECLMRSTDQTVGLLKRELEIRLAELAERWHFSSLEKIFIENRIYRDIEECETWESVISTIDSGLEPFKAQLHREVTRDDIIKLTEIKIKRISRYDSFKADEVISDIEDEMADVEHNLEELTEYAIEYFRALLSKYGKGRERRTEIRTFDTIEVATVAAANQKLYVNRQDGFIGYGLKKDEFVEECSDIDDIIVFRRDGGYQITKVSEKAFVGKDILHVAVWKRSDERMVYNVLYRDGASGKSFAKRFNVTAGTRDREYDLTTGSKGSKILYFTANPNSESEIVTISLDSRSRARIKEFDFDFGELDIKNRNAKGNTVTRYTVRKVVQKSQGASTLGGLDLYYDDAVGKLNSDERGMYLGSFEGDDRILVVYRDGSYELTQYEVSKRFEADKLSLIKKFDPADVLSVIYLDGESKNYYVKRFQIDTVTVDKRFSFVTDHKQTRLEFVDAAEEPVVKFKFSGMKRGERGEQTVNIADFIDVRGRQTQGNKLGNYKKISGLKKVQSE